MEHPRYRSADKNWKQCGQSKVDPPVRILSLPGWRWGGLVIAAALQMSFISAVKRFAASSEHGPWDWRSRSLTCARICPGSSPQLCRCFGSGWHVAGGCIL